VLNKLFGSAQHEHPDATQRLAGVAALPADSKVFAQLLATDPAPEVRAAAAGRCTDPAALAAALQAETEPPVRDVIAAALGGVVAALDDDGEARAVLAAPHCTDAVRAAVAIATQDGERCRIAIDGIGDESVLVDVALAAARAPGRLAAAERVHAPEHLRRLADGARDKDRGVARLARQRLDAIQHRERQAAIADEVLAQAEALVAQSGPIVMAAVELDRRWKALDLGDDAPRRAKWEAIERQMHERFEREREVQRAHARFEQRVDEWLASLQAAPPPAELPALRETLAALRAEGQTENETAALERLATAEQRLAQWEQAAPVLEAAEALVLEAERLAAAATPTDDANLPARWQALDLSARTPALTRRFEAALIAIEQRRLAQARAAQQQQGAARQRLHQVLHEAEQALAGGHLQEARTAVTEARALKPGAGQLPKPTVQRLGRVSQQLADLERWQKFGSMTAHIQLCERAEALGQQTLAPAAMAREVQQLRAEWKKLDTEHAGVPKPLWERFDAACEKAYAPAARHFAELSAQHKQARKQREEFIAATEAKVPEVLAEPRDWRAIERWLREVDGQWHGSTLGSVEPGAWKKLDGRFKAALAPARDALAAVRGEAKAVRQGLITEAQALAAKALDRDAPSQVKALQERWQQNAKAMSLAQRDERVLWEQFRTACNAVFDARRSSRQEADERKTAQRRALETLCEQLESLAQSAGADEAQLRRGRHDLQEQWKQAVAESGPPLTGVEARYRTARGSVDDALRRLARAQEAAVWRTLLDKARLCEELDALVLDGADADRAAGAIESMRPRWEALPAVAADWEKVVAARREAAERALHDDEAREDLVALIEERRDARRDALIEIELQLGLETPPDLQPQRLAMQVKQLRDRFKATGGEASAEKILLAWCSYPGVADERDRQRCERIIAKFERRR